MENTLFPGDKLIVSKLKYGPKLPESPAEIPWLNILYFSSTNSREKLNQPYNVKKRLKGTGNVDREDILIFKYPGQKTTHFVKRCVAGPGDTILINRGKLFINNKKTINPPGVKHDYNVWHKDFEKTIVLLDSLEVENTKFSFSEKERKIQVCLESKNVSTLLEVLYIDSVILKSPINIRSLSTFPSDTLFSWTPDYFGPLIIPYKGMRTKLNKHNIALYKKLIGEFENNKKYLESIFLNIHEFGSVEYTFKNNYYFMMGDNRHHSWDSRFFGVVPEDNIIGHVAMVLYSNKLKEKGFTRFFKIVE